MTRTTNGSFPPDARSQILKEDEYRCQICGEKGIEDGGTVPLEAHHVQSDPEEMEYHDPGNGTTLCVVCHRFVTTRIPDDLPFDFDEIQGNLELQPYDVEILSTLSQRGPSTISEICSSIENNKTKNATRERLWHLMGHDQRVDELSHPLVDQDAETSEWGLPHQIETSARGRIPDDKDALLNRIEDEMVRRLLDHGLSRDDVAEIMDVHSRTTHYRQKRALAYRLPLGDQSPASDDTASPQFQTLETFLTGESRGETETKASSQASLEPNSSEINHALTAVLSELEQLLELLDPEHVSERSPSSLTSSHS